MDNIIQILSKELEIKPEQAKAAVDLIDEGNTIPFIARYRKEATGSLNDEILRDLFDRLNYLRSLEERKATILASIEEQGKLTAELSKAIAKADTLVALEDLYLPYRPKRRTRAMIAMEKGLGGLAVQIWQAAISGTVEKQSGQDRNARNPAVQCRIVPALYCKEGGAETPEDAIAGARDILAERISDRAEIRKGIRLHTQKTGILHSTAKNPEEGSVYEMYYDYSEQVSKIPGHRVLALNRGEKEKILSIKLEVEEEKVIRFIAHQVLVKKDPLFTEEECAQLLDEAKEAGTDAGNKLADATDAAGIECLDTEASRRLIFEAAADSYKRLIAPAIEREIRNELTDQAEDGAIRVFGKNLEQLLMQPPIAGKVVLGWDPAFRTGCKLAVVDATGKVIDTSVIYPTAPTNAQKQESARKLLNKYIKAYGVDLISVGNGTASRESEQFIADFLRDNKNAAQVHYMITNEAGASVYSASKLATEEFPNFDVGQRSAASIARRVQDPLAELVKIDPKSIGVGQYQHDMNQKKLSGALEGVVENCVNRVGVDLNTASAALLSYIAGVSSAIAKNIVAYREEHGKFKTRRELLKVPKLGPKAFEQCAGFLRITDGTEPFDRTGVHPEAYAAMSALLEKLSLTSTEVLSGSKKIDKKAAKAFAEELGIGAITLSDNIKELMKPGRDPREDMPAPVLRSDVLQMEDLTPGMILKGTVRNVIDFGAFVDIGVHQDGLVHISELSEKKFVNHPLEVVSVGDVVTVRVLGVDMKKGRISLSMKQTGAGKS